jgi:hypothetical protein
MDGVSSANAYFGAKGIEMALQQGAQVIVTGRVVDSGAVANFPPPPLFCNLLFFV